MNIFKYYLNLVSCLAVGVLSGIATIKFVKGDEESGKNKQYNKELFSNEVRKNNHFIMFYAPWCRHCKQLSPTWEELASSYNADPQSDVILAKVDCTVDAELCSEQDVTGYPTLKFYKAGLADESAIKFKGTRDIPTLISFINSNLGNEEEYAEENSSVHSVSSKGISGLIELTDSNFEKVIDKGNFFVKFYAPWCGHCQKLAPTWEQLAKTFEGDESVDIAKADCTQHKFLCSLFEVKGYPTLIWFQDGKKVEVFRGHRTHEDLKAFVSQMLGSKSDERKSKETADTGSPVINLISSNFESQVKTGYTFVKFFAPWCGHCKRLAPTWEELSKKFSAKNEVTIAKVDCTAEENKQLCNDQEVDGYPTLFLYRNGEKISEYNGSRGLEDLANFINSHISRHDEL